MVKRISAMLLVVAGLVFIAPQALAVEVVSKTYEDGSTYNGWFVQNVPEGFGISAFANGDMYYGQFAGGKRSGFGVYLYAGGGMMAGFWENDMLHGMGMQLGNDQNRFEGIYQNNLPNGQGFSITPDGTMTAGLWENGICTKASSTTPNCRVASFTAQPYDNGDAYLGEVVDGKQEGYGVYCFSDGGYYVGQFHQGQFTGYGIYLNAQTGGYMVGSFESGQATGYVTSYYLDGTTYTSLAGAEQAQAATSSGASLCTVCHGIGWCPICRSGNGTYSNYGFSSPCSACDGTGKCYACGGSRFAK